MSAEQALSILAQATEPQAKLSRMGYVQCAQALGIFEMLIEQHKTTVAELNKAHAELKQLKEPKVEVDPSNRNGGTPAAMPENRVAAYPPPVHDEF